MKKMLISLLFVAIWGVQIQSNKIVPVKRLVIIPIEEILAPVKVKEFKTTIALSDLEVKVKKTKAKAKVKVAKKKTKRPDKVVVHAKKLLGVKYRYGGTSTKGIDCSAFVRKVYAKCAVNLPRTSRQQFKKGKKIAKHKAKKGDLIFFRGERSKSIGHVGIIIDPKKKLMIHASSGAKKVTITNYSKSYYIKHYKGVRRLS